MFEDFFFIFFLVSNSDIHCELKRTQEELFGITNEDVKDKQDFILGPEFYPAAVPISKSHITLFLFNADGTDERDNNEHEPRDKRLNVAIDTIKEAVREYQFWATSNKANLEPLNIRLEGVGHFNNSVIFAKPKLVESEHFEMLWKTLKKHLTEKNFIVENDTKQYNSSYSDFNPHVTLLKMSRVYKQSKNKHRKKRDTHIVPRKFPKACTDRLQEKEFGEQIVDRIELLSLNKEGKKGDYSYYFCQQEFFLTQDPIAPRTDCESNHTDCCSPLEFPFQGEESTESDTEKASEVGIARRKITTEKEIVRESVRTSMISMFRSKLGLDTHKSRKDTNLNVDEELSKNTYTSSAKNAIFFVAGSLLAITAIKMIFNRLAK